jgi:exonuclease III
MIHLGSWNVGSLIGKLSELVDIEIRRRVCVQEAKWTGQKAKEVENMGFKLWYTGKEWSRNGVGILIDKSLKNEVVAATRQGDRIIMIKLVFGDLVLNVISVYAPQVGLSDDVKRRFWKDLEDIVRGVPNSEKLFIGEDLNGHVDTTRGDLFDKLFNDESEKITIELDDSVDTNRRFVRRIQESEVKEALKK